MALPVAFLEEAAGHGFWASGRSSTCTTWFSTVAIVVSLTGGGATSESFVYIHIQPLVPRSLAFVCSRSTTTEREEI